VLCYALISWTVALATGAILTGYGSAGSAAPLSMNSAVHSTASESTRGGVQKTLFIADVDSNVLLYSSDIKQNNPPLLGQITQGVTRSVAVAVDRRNTLYVVNFGGNSPSIAEYKQGTTSPFKTLTNGLRAPEDIVVDRELNVYVVDSGSVLVYARGASSPSRVIPISSSFTGGLALATNGDLLVATFDTEHQSGAVYSIAPGSSQAHNLNLQSVPGPSLGTDGAGYIYVGGHSGDISVYAPGSTTASRFINANADGFYTNMDVLPNGTIYWPNYDDRTMYEFSPGASGPANVFTTSGSGIGAAVGSW